MRKKVITLLLVTAMMLCVVAGLIACENEHVHSYGEWVEVTPASCSSEGLERRTCECGESEERAIGKLPHTPKDVERKESTCSEAGHEAGTVCSVCGETISGMQELALNEHSYGEWSEVIPASCSSEGKQQRMCSVCQHVDEKKIDKLAHTPMDVERKEPTCSEAGHEAGKVCSKCGETISGMEVLETVAHTFTEWAPSVPATCTSKGQDERYCLVCDTKEQRESEMVAHSFGEWRTTSEATCTALGKKKRNCTRCQYEETETVEMKQHSLETIPRKEPTCEAPGEEAGEQCTECGFRASGFEEIPANGHTMGVWEMLSDATCTQTGTQRQKCLYCEFTKTDTIQLKDHTVEIIKSVDPTCLQQGWTEGRRCSVCEEILEEQQPIEALGHKYGPNEYQGNGTDNHYHAAYCERCRAVQISGICQFDTVETPATCTEAKHHVHTCSECNYRYEHDEGEPLGHMWSEWRPNGTDESGKHIHIKICLRAGDEEGHEIQQAQCNETVNTVEATCDSIGYTTHNCEECGNTYEDGRVDATGHSFDSYEQELYHGMVVHKAICSKCGKEPNYYTKCTLDTVVTEPTCTTEGTKTETCRVCKLSIVTKISDALNHEYGTYQNVDGEHHKKVCQRKDCNDELIESCRFVEADEAPTCGVAGKDREICSDCLYVKELGELEALQHEYNGWKSNKRGEHFHTCNKCGHMETNNCAYEITLIPATCDTQEKKTYKCDTCNDTYTEITSEAYGHVFETWETDDLQHISTCTKCKFRLEENHDFRDSNICALCHYDGLTYEYGDDAHTYAQVKIDNTTKNSKNIIVASSWQDTPVKKIAEGGFSGYVYIETIQFPSTLEEICDMAFYGCRTLTKVTVDDVENSNLHTIGAHAFAFCSSLEDAHFPESLKKIGESAFVDCTKLKDIYIPDTVVEIGSRAFHNTAYVNDKSHWDGNAIYISHHLIKADPEQLNGEYIILRETTMVSAEAFKDCVNLNKIVVPDSVIMFDANAFAGCENLHEVDYEGTFKQFLEIKFENDKASPLYYAKIVDIVGAEGNVSIPEGTKSLPAGLFRNSQITEITLPESVTEIGANAFSGCTMLATVTVKGKLTKVGADAFTGSLYYDTQSNWTDEGLLYIGGALIAADMSKAKNVVTEITVQEGTTAIAAGAFDNYSGVTKITIPLSVMNIGAGAFNGIKDTVKEATFTPASSKGGYYFAYTANGMGRALRDDRLTDPNLRGSVASDIKLYNGEWRRTPAKD